MGVVGSIMSVLMYLGPFISSGVDSGTHADGIRNSIGQIEEATKEWKNKYEQLTSGLNKEVGDILNALTQLNVKYANINTKLEAQRTAHAASLKSNQMLGIIFVSVIFFALLMKQFNLLGPVIHFLSIPERFVWNYIVHGHASASSAASGKKK